MPKSYFVEPFVDKGLGNSAYLIGSDDTKTVADPGVPPTPPQRLSQEGMPT